MKFIILSIFFSLLSFAVMGQENNGTKKPTIESAKSEMVLRPNTRDKQASVHDNRKNLHIQKRKQVIQRQQLQLRKKRMEQMRNHRFYRQRMIQQRKIRQETLHRGQMQRRR